MKYTPYALHICLILIFLYPTNSFSATYYVDPTKGSDKYSGLNPDAAWQSISKVNSQATAGDTVLLASDQTFYETLILRSGITYSNYGGAGKAIISGRRQVDAPNVVWQKIPTLPIYSTTLPASLASAPVSMVFIGNERLTRARVPNVGQGSFSAPRSNFAKIARDGDPWTLNVSNDTVPPGADVAGATAMIRTRGSDLGEYSVDGWYPGGVNSLKVKAVSFTEDWYIAHEYTIPNGHGYWLENKLWMLDSPGEWFYDKVTRKLHVWMPNGLSPKGQGLHVAVLPHGIVGRDIKSVTVSNIQVLDTASDGISISAATAVVLNNISIERAGRRGISFAGSSSSKLTNLYIEDSASDGIWLGYFSPSNQPTPPSRITRSVNVSITGTSILNSGKLGYSQTAVRLGEGGLFSNNRIQNAPYIGVFATQNNYIEGNLLLNTCSAYADCGGIYVSQPSPDPALVFKATPSTPITRTRFASNVSILNNIIDGGTGSSDGLPQGGGDDTRGIYLDDYANGVRAFGNFVTGMKYGLMLHTAFNNSLNDNLLIRNRSHNILLQENEVPTHGGASSVRGEMTLNSLNGNILVASKSSLISSLAIPHILHSAQGGNGPTRMLAKYDRNQYATMNPNASQTLAYNYGSDNPVQDMDFGTWRSIGNDVNGGFRPYRGESEAYGFYNSSSSENLSINCPTPAVANCDKFVNLQTGTRIVFPLKLAPKVSIIVIR